MNLLKMENGDFLLKEVERDGDYVFCSSRRGIITLLFRVLGDKEWTDRAPDALLITDENTERLLYISDQFNKADVAFKAIKNNETILKKALIPLEGIPKKEQDAIDRSSGILCYDYLFNYFGQDYFKEQMIVGAAVSIAFRPIRNGKVVKLTEEPVVEVTWPTKLSDMPRIADHYLSDVLHVAFDNEELISITVDEKVEDLFLDAYDWDAIDYEIQEYELEYADAPYRFMPMTVSKAEWETFLSERLGDFDIPDNKNANCPSYGWLKLPKDGTNQLAVRDMKEVQIRNLQTVLDDTNKTEVTVTATTTDTNGVEVLGKTEVVVSEIIKETSDDDLEITRQMKENYIKNFLEDGEK